MTALAAMLSPLINPLVDVQKFPVTLCLRKMNNNSFLQPGTWLRQQGIYLFN